MSAALGSCTEHGLSGYNIEQMAQIKGKMYVCMSGQSSQPPPLSPAIVNQLDTPNNDEEMIIFSSHNLFSVMSPL